MKAVIQRVSNASVEVGGKTVGCVGPGLLVLLGVEKEDTESSAVEFAEKVRLYRVFEDANGKMNLSVADISGDVLVVSQFTVCANCNKGRRPSFDPAAAPDKAELLYEKFVSHLKSAGLNVETGIFGAMMDVKLVNKGPVTFVLETN